MIEMRFCYENVTSMEFYGDCSSIPVKENENIFKKCTIANKKEVHKLLKKFGFEEEDFQTFKVRELTKYSNPYKYYKSKNYIVIVHSGIEYFYKITYKE